MSLTSSLPHAFGLHISDRALKLVLLRPRVSLWNKALPIVDIAAEKKMPEGIIVGGEIKKRDLLLVEMRELLNQNRIKKISRNVGVVANLPESKTFLKFVTLGGKTDEEINNHILKSVTSEIPLPQDELVTDTQIFKNQTGTHSALIGAAAKSSVDAFTSVLEEIGMTIFALEPESIATARAVLPIASEDGLKKTEMIIDIGSEKTSAIFTTGCIPRLTTLVPFSGNLLTKIIAEKLNTTYEKAEEIKTRCGLNIKKCDGALKIVLNDIINELVSHLKNAIKFYHLQFIDAPKVGIIHLSGGGAYLLKLDSIISRELRIKARLADIFRNVSLPKGNDNSSPILHYATAIGLSLRGASAPFPEHE